MKVKKLIAELKKMPQNCDVVVAAFDHQEYEFAGFVSNVYVVDFKKCPKDQYACDIQRTIVKINA